MRDLKNIQAPAAWASYLINGDGSSLYESEIMEARKWIKEHGYPVSCGESYIGRWGGASRGEGPVICDLCDFAILEEKDDRKTEEG